MRVDRGGDFLVSRLHIDRETELGDHLCGVCANDVRSDDLAVLLADKEFDKALALADRQSLAAGHERELADLEFDTLLDRRALGETNARDLRLAIGATREDGDFFRLLTGKHAFHALDGFVAGHMREPWWPDDVARAVDAFDARLIAVVGFEITFGIGLEFHAFRHER